VDFSRKRRLEIKRKQKNLLHVCRLVGIFHSGVFLAG
jgi:hypothetical protein